VVVPSIWLEVQYRRGMRKLELDLARAMVEEGMTGEHRQRALERIAEAERQL